MSAHKISLIVILVFLASAAGANPSPCTRGDMTVAEMLELATASYEEGSLEQAMCQLETAQAMIAAELDEPALPEPPPVRSNAVQLVAFLDLYRMFVLGDEPELDEVWSDLMDVLIVVADLESFPEPPDRFRDMRVHTWHGGQIRRLGDIRIGHWASGQINRVGDHSISYWADGMPIQIGGIRFRYHAGETRPYQVAGVRID